MSKFSLDILDKCVFPFVKGYQDPDIILGAAFGEDVALTRVGDDILASHVDPIVGAVAHIGWLAVHVACNDIATSGFQPRWILLLVLVPDMEDKTLLEQIMHDANRAASEIGASIIGGHTGYSAGLSRPLVAVTALGTASGRDPILTGGANVGDYVLVTKGLALEGTSILAQDFVDIAKDLGLNESELAQGRQLLAKVSVLQETRVLAENGVTAMHDVTRGGILETLLEIAQLSKVGIEINYEQLPIPDIVSRFAQAFQFDPLQMISSGTLAATVPPEHVEDVRKAFETLEIPFAYIGRVIEGKGVHIHQGDKVVHHTEIRCEADELARLWALYPRD